MTADENKRLQLAIIELSGSAYDDQHNHEGDEYRLGVGRGKLEALALIMAALDPELARELLTAIEQRKKKP